MMHELIECPGWLVWGGAKDKEGPANFRLSSAKRASTLFFFFLKKVKSYSCAQQHHTIHATKSVCAVLCPNFSFTQRLCLSLFFSHCLSVCDILASLHNRRGRAPVLDRGSDFISNSSTSKAVRSIRVHPARRCRAHWRPRWWCTGNGVIVTAPTKTSLDLIFKIVPQ